MEIKRCVRCGSLHTTESQVCNECSIKDNAEVVKLKGILNEGFEIGTTKQDLAIKAGREKLALIINFLSIGLLSNVLCTKFEA